MTRLLCITLFGELCGSSRVRVLQFVPYLDKNGIKCTTKKLFSDDYFKVITNQKKANSIIKKTYGLVSGILSALKRMKYVWIAKKYDAVLIQKDVFPIILQKILKKRCPNIIFEFDDAIFEPSPYAKGIQKVYDYFRKKNLPNFLKICKHVICENSYLADYAKKYNAHVSIITAPIDTDEFHPVEQKNNSKKITLGWIGSAFTTNQLKLLIAPLEIIGAKYPDVKLKLIGADDSVKFKKIKVENIKWSLNTVLRELQSFDIGLMPLNDDPFNKGRLGYKIIQYMSIGIPIVASNTGLNKKIIINDKNGFLASNDKEWIDKLSLLIENNNLSKRLGSNGRKMAVKNYSIKKAQKKFLHIFKKINKK